MSIVPKGLSGSGWDRALGVPHEDEDEDEHEVAPDVGGSGYVYFIGRDDMVSPVKIGFSQNPDRRLADFQAAHWERLVIHGVLFGGQDLESALHSRLAKFRIRGEWFSRCSEVEEYLASAEVYEPPPLPLVDVVWRDGEFLVVDVDSQEVYYRSENEDHAQQFASAANALDRQQIGSLNGELARRTRQARRSKRYRSRWRE